MGGEIELARDIKNNVDAIWRNQNDQGALDRLHGDAMQISNQFGDFKSIGRVNDALRSVGGNDIEILDDGQIMSQRPNPAGGWTEVRADESAAYVDNR